MRIIGPITVWFTSPWIINYAPLSFIHSLIGQLTYTIQTPFMPHFKAWIKARKRSFCFFGQPASSCLSITTSCSLATDTTTHVQIRRNGNEVCTGIVRAENNVKQYEYSQRDSLKMREGRETQITVFISRQYLQREQFNSSDSLLKITVLCECVISTCVFFL